MENHGVCVFLIMYKMGYMSVFVCQTSSLLLILPVAMFGYLDFLKNSIIWEE